MTQPAWDRRPCFRAARHGAVIFGIGPELHPLVIGPEAVVALRQGEDHLAVLVVHPVEAGVGLPVKGVDIQTGVRITSP